MSSPSNLDSEQIFLITKIQTVIINKSPRTTIKLIVKSFTFFVKLSSFSEILRVKSDVGVTGLTGSTGGLRGSTRGLTGSTGGTIGGSTGLGGT